MPFTCTKYLNEEWKLQSSDWFQTCMQNIGITELFTSHRDMGKEEIDSLFFFPEEDTKWRKGRLWFVIIRGNKLVSPGSTTTHCYQEC